MTINDVQKSIEAELVEGTGLADIEIICACGADLMSDVMAFVKDQVLLLTGLINVQVIRTAILMDIQAICFVRGKTTKSGNDRDGKRERNRPFENQTAALFGLRQTV